MEKLLECNREYYNRYMSMLKDDNERYIWEDMSVEEILLIDHQEIDEKYNILNAEYKKKMEDILCLTKKEKKDLLRELNESKKNRQYGDIYYTWDNITRILCDLFDYQFPYNI